MFRARLRARLCRGKEGLHRAPTLSDNLVGIPTFCYYFYPPPTIVHFFIHSCPKYTHTTLRLSKGGLKRQSLLQTWCGSAPRRGPSANGYDAWRLDPADPGARSLQLLLQTWCGSAPRRGPSANGYDAWRFGSCCCCLHINRSGLNHSQ